MFDQVVRSYLFVVIGHVVGSYTPQKPNVIVAVVFCHLIDVGFMWAVDLHLSVETCIVQINIEISLRKGGGHIRRASTNTKSLPKLTNDCLQLVKQIYFKPIRDFV